ncbi:MAG: hypothetical protein B6I18_07900 [Bacteroidetes bacterium 4572_112]|nr:MAG: hypothetical protein B6I18_07900 [Bacteroidetes bacterium 4572_112]
MKYRHDVKYYSLNGKLIDIGEFLVSVVRSSGLIYEVIKYTDGAYLYFKEHLQRMQTSLRIANKAEVDIVNIETDARNLALANGINVGNLKIVIKYQDSTPMVYLFFIPHRYPSATQYKVGVKVRLQYDVRANPKAKIANWDIRDKANRLIDSNNIYETLLVNEDGDITEGSRSNVFFMKENTFYTADDSIVLSGITRMKLLENLFKLDCNIKYEAVNIADLSKYTHCFITGTSPGILPVSTIDEISFRIDEDLLLKIS